MKNPLKDTQGALTWKLARALKRNRETSERIKMTKVKAARAKVLE